MMKMRSVLKSRTAGWAVAGGMAALLGCGGCSRGLAPASRAGSPRIPVTMTVARAQNVDVTLEGLGTVTPVSTVTVTSRVAGVLTEVCYREGQMVKRGQLLAVVDPGPYRAAVLQAQGQLARDQALLSNAQIDLDRYRDAYAKHAIPEQEVATQEAAVREYQGTVKLDQGMLDAAQVNLDYTQIRSPIDGRVGLRLVDVGNIVQANGTNAIVTITQLQPMTVVFTLSQDVLPQVIRAMNSGEAMPVDAYDRAGGRAIASGKLLTIDNEADPSTGTFRLKAVFPNPDDALWPNTFVNAKLVTRVDRGAVTVPARAVQTGPNGSYLFVIRPDQTVEMRNVSVSAVEGGTAVIAQGLSVGEHVVLDGQFRLDQGTPVKIVSGTALEGS